ncbi:drug resistance transporter, EmrB/QacA subfamily [Anaerocolumna jejuensis DSM 15929]|uniref:Drug resistance transporter, EmrB/QacA subfamily n=1 Tax=Anaerocolumna jejuensis DSM 15929 TaxID=1121322 RepID=A0A1M6PXN8_9FIRM|nr:MFS transporter [Anaerocolumna jejuensis]SHK12709.1 drug resistance transporter, EmrB/QacA subfamily [Anaerocolumna jejuensis DSM 15929]
MQTNQKKTNLTVVTVALGTFMTCFDINAVNVALPLMQTAFHTTIAVVEWVVVAYLLTLCTTQLTFGRISDLYGLKKVYVSGFIGFTVASIFCGLSANIAMLIVFRVLEALSGAMMMASGSAIVTNSVLPENRGKALSITSMAVAVATCAGPSLGGFLASAFGWNSIFFLNIPIGLIGTMLAMRNIQPDAPKAGAKFDSAGSILIMASLTLILLPLDRIGKTNVNSISILISLFLGITLLAVFLIYEKKCSHPILNLNLFKNRVFAVSNFAATFFYMSEFMMVFLAPYYLQQQHRFSASVSGLIMLPMSLMMMAIAPVSGAISDKSDSRLISSAGLGILAAAIFIFSSFRPDTSPILLLLAFAVTGMGAGLFHTPNNSAVMGSAPAQSRGVASATLGTMRNIGMVLGEAISAALLSSRVSYATSAFAAKGVHGTLLQQDAFNYAMRTICIVAACCALAALMLTLFRGKTRRAVG